MTIARIHTDYEQRWQKDEKTKVVAKRDWELTGSRGVVHHGPSARAVTDIIIKTQDAGIQSHGRTLASTNAQGFHYDTCQDQVSEKLTGTRDGCLQVAARAGRSQACGYSAPRISGAIHHSTCSVGYFVD
jgi:hypothetical protein